MNVACACGIFAIGRCADCGIFVCGQHSALWEGRLTCSDDIKRHRQEASEKKRKADAEAQQRADQDTIASLTSRVAKGTHAIERWLLARTSNLATANLLYKREFSSDAVLRAAIDRVRTLIEEAPGAGSVGVADSDVKMWWVETPELIHWLTQRREPDTTLQAGLFRTYTGWRIGSGYSSGGYRDSGWNYDFILRTDGRVCTVTQGSSKLDATHRKIHDEFGDHDRDIYNLARYLNLA